MVFGETYEQFADRTKAWHRWFAWRPVILLDGRCAWLCHVERRLDPATAAFAALGGCSTWDYRLPEGR